MSNTYLTTTLLWMLTFCITMKFQSLKPVGPKMCDHLCKYRAGCTLHKYSPSALACELAGVKDGSHQPIAIKDTNNKYAQKNLTCQEGAVIFHTRANKLLCRRLYVVKEQRCKKPKREYPTKVDYFHEFPGCGTPPVFESISPIYDGHYQGAVAQYTCPANYVSCNTTCFITGQWERINSGCVRKKWENTTSTQASPLRSESVFCKDTKFFTLRMTATPKSRSLSVNLGRGFDILLHVAINHPRHSYRHVVDTFIDGSWIQPRPMALGPVYIDKLFTMQIDYISEVYKVTMDGVEVCSYPEKKPGAMFENFTVVSNGHLDVHCLEITP